MAHYLSYEDRKILERGNSKYNPEYFRVFNKLRDKCKKCDSYECECNSITLDQWIPK